MEASSVETSAYSTLPAVAMTGLGAASPTIDKKALRMAQGDISVKGSVPLNQQMFIYSINLHLMRISQQQSGEVFDKLA